MAVRVDLYSVRDRHTFAPGGPADPGWVGFVAASDDDESQLVELLESCSASGVLVGAVTQGSGVEAAAADAFGAVPVASPLARIWMDVIGWAAETAAVEETALGWLTRYDRGGSRDDGADEWKTSWSDAPTEGTGADTPWPSS